MRAREGELPQFRRLQPSAAIDQLRRVRAGFARYASSVIRYRVIVVLDGA